MDYQIIIERKNSTICCLKTYTVYLDGEIAGKLKNGQSLLLLTSEGQHTLTFKAFKRVEKVLPIYIPSNNRITKIFAKLNMLSGKIELSMSNLNAGRDRLALSRKPQRNSDGYFLSPITDMPYSFCIDNVSYNIENADDIAKMPIPNIPFTINGQRWYMNTYLRICAVKYSQAGRPDIAINIQKRLLNQPSNRQDTETIDEETPSCYDFQQNHTLFMCDESLFSSFKNTFIPKCCDEDMYTIVKQLFEHLSFSKVLLLNVELVPFSALSCDPCLLTPIITDRQKAISAVAFIKSEMQKRYALFAKSGTRNILRYNDHLLDQEHISESNERILPHILIVIDELSFIINEDESAHEDFSYLLLRGQNAGIHILAFSYRPEKETRIKDVSDLLCVQSPSRFLSSFNADTEMVLSDSPIELELEKIDAMNTDGWRFEQYAVDLLMKNGFPSAEVTSGSNDYGVDVIATDANGVRYAIQCKCYSSKLSNSPIQEVVAGMIKYNCQVGVVLTNNYFTANATELAKSNNILLWDRDKLTQMIENAK